MIGETVVQNVHSSLRSIQISKIIVCQ